MRWLQRRLCVCGHPRDLHGGIAFTCCDVAYPLCPCLVFRWWVRSPKWPPRVDDEEDL